MTALNPLRGMRVSADFNLATVDRVGLFTFVRASGKDRCPLCDLRVECKTRRGVEGRMAYCGSDSRPDGSFGRWALDGPGAHNYRRTRDV
jgi:hypothetical protein